MLVPSGASEERVIVRLEFFCRCVVRRVEMSLAANAVWCMKCAREHFTAPDPDSGKGRK